MLPPSGEVGLASLATALEGDSVALVGSDGAPTPLPDEVRRVLEVVVGAMARGLAVSVTAHNTQLTVQEAADLLGIERPRLVRLLDHGAIPFEHRERRRIVRLADVLGYQERVRAARRADLDELARAAGQRRADGTPQQQQARGDE